MATPVTAHPGTLRLPGMERGTPAIGPRVTVNLRQAPASSAAPKETSKRSHQMLTLL